MALGLFAVDLIAPEPEDQAKWRVNLFGRFAVRFGLRAAELCEGSKLQELCAYLVLHHDRPHTREMVASLLWAESTTAQSKANLRKALWQLQRVLDRCSAGRGPSLLQVDAEWLQVDPSADVWVDIASFERGYALCQGAPGKELRPEAARELSQAVALYRGDLMENRYQEWCLVERERLKHIYLLMLEKLADFCEVRAEHEAGLLYAIEILRHDGLRERTHRQMMRLHYLRGDRGGALKQYQDCAAILEQELGVEPMEETVRLAEEIRHGRWRAATSPPAARSDTSASTTEALRVMLDRLHDLHLGLDEVQRQAEVVARGIAHEPS